MNGHFFDMNGKLLYFQSDTFMLEIIKPKIKVLIRRFT